MNIKKILIKVLMILISVIAIFANTKVNAAYINSIYNNQYYCVQKGVTFKAGTFTNTKTVDFDNNTVTGGSTPTANQYAIGYIFSQGSDTLLSDTENSRISQIASYLYSNYSYNSNSVRHYLNEGLYNLSSVRQNAIWAINKGGSSASTSSFFAGTYWDTSSKLSYSWTSDHTTHTIVKDGTRYKFTCNCASHSSEALGIATWLFGSGNDYYTKSYNLYRDAFDFGKSYSGATSNGLVDKTIGTPTLDYQTNYVYVGPYKLEKNVTTIDSVKFYEDSAETKQINSSIIGLYKKSGSSYSKITNLSSWTGGEYYVGIKLSSSMPTQLTRIKFTYKTKKLSGKIQYWTASANQNLVSGNTSLSDATVSVNVDKEVKLIPPIQITLNKADALGTKIPGAKFTVTYSNGLASETKTTGPNGKIEFTKRNPTSMNSFKATITEDVAPTGYKKLDNSIELNFVYDSANANWNVTCSQEGVTVDNLGIVSGISKTDLTVDNKAVIDKLTVLKLDSQDGSKIEGAKFSISLSNIEAIEDTTIPSGIVEKMLSAIEATLSGNDDEVLITNSNGEIVINNLVVQDLSQDVTITLKEIEAPIGYKKIEEDIVVVLRRSGTSYTISSVSDSENASATVSSNKVEIRIKNIPIMNVGGIAWKDGQTGVKNVQAPNNKYDEGEELLAGIKVYLTQSGEIDEETPVTTTGENGRYLFEGVEKKNNYVVVFEYDGMTYQAVAKGTEKNASKADEIGRDEFNNKFKTIEKGKAIPSNIDLQYNTNGTTSELIYDEDNMKMQAKAAVDVSNWKNTWTLDGNVNEEELNTNLGLAERVFDLAVGMDVYNAELTINGKSTVYDFNQIIDGTLADLSLDELVNGKSAGSREDITYNLYLQQSDYRYRISDYKTDDPLGVSKNNYHSINENDNTTNGDYVEIGSDLTDESELKAFVTYEVMLKNQTNYNAKVNELAYYYDENYTFVSAKDSSGNPITFADDSSLPQITGKNSAKITLNNATLNDSDNYRQVIYITFEIKKDSRGISLGEYANLVEILSYSTDEGLIDQDSQPGNANEQFEDDTDQAQGLKVSVKETSRVISGTVFEDTSKDGKNDNNEAKVNDVIVQLIEVKLISGKYYEYIWQETRSGQNTVKTTSRNGYPGEEYTVGNIGQGEYKFTDFIPGNYIVRFIYGDGKTYNLYTDNVKKYNGQDYKSTIDPNYHEEWYNKATSNMYVVTPYEDNSSVARDNEARRLTVMSYSTTIDAAIGNELERKTIEMLNATWMCAETSKINVQVDAQLDKNDIHTESSNTQVSFDHIIDTIAFNNINFGLALRPQTKLSLEKHITALKITPTGTGVTPIVNARANINDILDNHIDLSGLKDHLSTIKSTRRKQRILESRNRYRRISSRCRIRS